MPRIKYTEPMSINPRLPVFEEPPPPCSQSRAEKNTLLRELEEIKHATISTEKCQALQMVVRNAFTKITETVAALKVETSPTIIDLLRLRLRKELSNVALYIYEFTRCERALGIPRSNCLSELEKFVLDSY